MGRDLKANTSRLSSQRISTRFTKRGEFLWRSVAAAAVAVQLLTVLLYLPVPSYALSTSDNQPFYPLASSIFLSTHFIK